MTVIYPNLIVRLSESYYYYYYYYCSSVTLRGPPLSRERKELSETRWCQNDRIFQLSAWVTRPERPKAVKDEVKRPEGAPARSQGPEGP